VATDLKFTVTLGQNSPSAICPFIGLLRLAQEADGSSLTAHNH
jgi:hypothetical protein